jgi:hypothetical protein
MDQSRLNIRSRISKPQLSKRGQQLTAIGIQAQHFMAMIGTPWSRREYLCQWWSEVICSILVMSWRAYGCAVRLCSLPGALRSATSATLVAAKCQVDGMRLCAQTQLKSANLAAGKGFSSSINIWQAKIRRSEGHDENSVAPACGRQAGQQPHGL